MTLENALKKASLKVWKELKPVSNPDHAIYDVREEALTTMALRELSNSNCPKITAIKMIPPKKESKDGYDFELAIGSDKKKKFIRFFIQSKRLSGTNLTDSYKAYDAEQTVKLLAFAKKAGGVPTYAFLQPFGCEQTDA